MFALFYAVPYRLPCLPALLFSMHATYMFIMAACLPERLPGINQICAPCSSMQLKVAACLLMHAVMLCFAAVVLQVFLSNE